MVKNKTNSKSKVDPNGGSQGVAKGTVVKKDMEKSRGAESTDEALFEDDFDPDEYFENRKRSASDADLEKEMPSDPASSSSSSSSNAAVVSSPSARDIRIKKKTKLGADWVLADSRPVQTLSIGDAISRVSALAEERESSKAKDIVIKKRTPKSESVVAKSADAEPGGTKNPERGQIFKAKVTYIESFGLFMQLPPPYGTGLVHNSQISFNKDPSVKKKINLHDRYYVKVLKSFTSKDKTGNDRVNIDLSMKYCEQVRLRDNEGLHFVDITMYHNNYTTVFRSVELIRTKIGRNTTKR